MENWKEQYNQLVWEGKKYYKDDFAEVYKYLLEDNISIDEAIIKIGANYNAEDISNLKRCDEILAQGTKLVMDNSEELINEGNAIMYDLILALSNEKIKKTLFFENLKKEDSKKTHITLVENVLKYIEEMQDEKVMKIYICDSTKSVFNSILRKLDGVEDVEILEVSHMSRKIIKHGTTDVPIQYFYTEISMKDVDKWYAIEFLLKKLNINKEEVITIGDNTNDKMMLEEAGLGVVMKGSTPVVTEIADFITDDNNNEGVAKAIEKCVLK